MAAASAGVGTGSEASPERAPTPGIDPRVHADLDGDGLFDDLEAAISGPRRVGPLPVIIGLRRPASRQTVSIVKDEVGEIGDVRRFTIVDAFAASMTESQIRAAALLPVVRQVEKNPRVHAANDGAQASFGVTSARVDAPGLDGDGDGDSARYSPDDLVAAVLDTGIDSGHRDLDEGKVLAFQDFVNGQADAYDDHFHGTHVAATLAGEGDAREDRRYAGVAPAAGLVGVKVLDAGGVGTAMTCSLGSNGWSKTKTASGSKP